MEANRVKVKHLSCCVGFLTLLDNITEGKVQGPKTSQME